MQGRGNYPNKKHKYKDPIQYANQTAYHLKKIKKCDYVICLSHLGFDYKGKKVSDKILASESENIDLIIGGHTHTFLEKPVIEKNSEGKESREEGQEGRKPAQTSVTIGRQVASRHYLPP